MRKNKIIKPWNVNFMAFLVLFILSPLGIKAQNRLEKHIQADGISSISINGNQIFNISVSTSKTNQIKMTSTLDGEYQNDFQMVSIKESSSLKLNLEHLSFTEIPDDKRNAHKVIAATLHLEIPENLSLDIVSDIASVDLNGKFKTLFIELQQGQCSIHGSVETTTVNTFDGDINVITKSAMITAQSNHGNVVLDKFYDLDSIWILKSINGDITVEKQI
ncbi:hypothetical protein [Winogradskyella psychrotolerans]|uniref:hypothetical protein n=1 Tax=Winogradskyella psychrotolerans TaxID=1344585 RepID=UPI001C06C6D0|nr:hypothetical protein [Winogradskyella psychrotolerans]MBU2927991.1 hypothetical protein [Winogradskyella psychrotolerans]